MRNFRQHLFAILVTYVSLTRIKDVINMVLWKYKDKVSEFTLVISDRFLVNAEIPFDKIERVDNYYIYLTDGETVIPIHRVLEIRRNGKTIWSRK
ncbi:MAG: RNA repair domain-containing protein [Acidianus infernus]|nr:RNA repair domain-containing protein [Acidianus infernus]